MLKLPNEILRLAKKGDSELPSYVSALVVLDLFRQRSISAGKAAEVLGLDRQGFMDIVDEHGIPLVNLTGSEAAEEWDAWCAQSRSLWAVVSDAGPIIGYARTGYLHLLQGIFGEVLIPEQVEREIWQGATARVPVRFASSTGFAPLPSISSGPLKPAEPISGLVRARLSPWRRNCSCSAA